MLQLSPVASAAPSVTDRSHHTWSFSKNSGCDWTRLLPWIPLDYRADFRWPGPGREFRAGTLWLKDSNQSSGTHSDFHHTDRPDGPPTRPRVETKEAQIDSGSTSMPAQARCRSAPLSSVIRTLSRGGSGIKKKKDAADGGGCN